MRSDLELSTLFVVDDDQAVRDSLCFLAEAAGIRAQTFESAQAFLDAYDDSPGCLVTDIRMPGMNGLDLQEHLRAAGFTLPIIVLTGHGDVPAAVRALKAGATDFVEKPFEPERLLALVRESLTADLVTREASDRRADIRARLDELTRREREVMEHVVTGEANKVIAIELGISERTVEIHRGRVMRKMAVRSVAELVALVHDA